MARIAIVDDSRLARTFAASALRGHRHEVREIEPTSLFSVLETLKSYRPDLVIVDYLMPLCPGLSLIRACTEDEHLAQMRILVLTAHREEEAIGLLEGMGVRLCLHKPVAPEALLEAVKRVLGRP
jgi:DNA-binding response OmpR family regulator